MKLLITNDMQRESQLRFKNLGYEVFYHTDQPITEELVRDVDVVMGFSVFQQQPIEAFHRLKFIQLFSAGINHLPLEDIQQRNISLANNRGAYSTPIAEWILMRILEINKLSLWFYEAQKDRRYEKEKRELLEVTDQKIAFIGTGSIATEAAKRLAPFGGTLVGFNTRGRPAEYFHETYPIATLKDHVGDCDFLVVTCPYTEETHRLVHRGILEAMKPEASLINIARGAIVDEASLIDVLQNRRIKAAALDVFEKEPLPPDSPLWSLDNALISPHITYISTKTQERTLRLLEHNLKSFKENQPLQNKIDLSKKY